MKPGDRTTTDFVEAFSISVVCFGLFSLWSIQSVLSGFRNRSITNNGLWELVALELFLGAVAISILYLRGFAVLTLYPQPSARGCWLGFLLFLVSWLLAILIASPFDTVERNEPLTDLLAGSELSIMTVLCFSVVNGVFEEVFLLGFLLKGLRGHGLLLALGFSLLVRVVYHTYQGPLGTVSVLGFGLVLSLCFVRSGSLFPPVFAHVLADIFALVQ